MRLCRFGSCVEYAVEGHHCERHTPRRVNGQTIAQPGYPGPTQAQSARVGELVDETLEQLAASLQDLPSDTALKLVAERACRFGMRHHGTLAVPVAQKGPK